MHNVGSFDPSAANMRITAFLSRLPEVRSRSLLFNYDGTLAPFSCSSEPAHPHPDISNTLGRIQRETDTRLAIVTGRPASEIAPLLKLMDVEVWGCHGLERLRADGSREFAKIDPRLLAAIEAASKLIESEGMSDFAVRQRASIAIHWRGRESIAEHLVRKMRRIWSMIPDKYNLRLAPFDGGIEIRPATRDKGDAVRSIFYEMGPTVAMAYLGNDPTDEDAFGALIGRGLSILVREEYRPTLADAWIKPPEALLSFLYGWIAACRAS